jgi:hypothetical protein
MSTRSQKHHTKRREYLYFRTVLVGLIGFTLAGCAESKKRNPISDSAQYADEDSGAPTGSGETNGKRATGGTDAVSETDTTGGATISSSGGVDVIGGAGASGEIFIVKDAEVESRVDSGNNVDSGIEGSRDSDVTEDEAGLDGSGDSSSVPTRTACQVIPVVGNCVIIMVRGAVITRWFGAAFREAMFSRHSHLKRYGTSFPSSDRRVL